jgi:hypothetical protein
MASPWRKLTSTPTTFARIGTKKKLKKGGVVRLAARRMRSF